ncbi:hypothetical protein PUN28_014650 [Cardiocondyla obscurior]|uniref:Transmembrane protein n=1 Tax=Cardiocondyla obscurior TaxID=286306 RepID=A0AAW2EUQ9_9HYME
MITDTWRSSLLKILSSKMNGCGDRSVSREPSGYTSFLVLLTYFIAISFHRKCLEIGGGGGGGGDGGSGDGGSGDGDGDERENSTVIIEVIVFFRTFLFE